MCRLEYNYRNNLILNFYQIVLKNDFLIFCDIGLISKEHLFEIKSKMIKNSIKQIFLHKKIFNKIFKIQNLN